MNHQATTKSVAPLVDPAGAVPAGLLMAAERSLLVAVDFQARLMPQIEQGHAVLAQARRLIASARVLGVPALVTEQNPRGLGSTVAELDAATLPVIEKHAFGACATPEFAAAIGVSLDIVLCGCEAHVCVQQTALGLLELGRRVFLVRDAVGSRRVEDKQTALDRLARHGAEIVTAEMVIFEWLRTSRHEKFKDVLALIK